MQKLHLVGFTTDHDGLILSIRRGARSGSYQLAVDDALLDAVDELQTRRAVAAAEEAEETPEPGRPARIESALPVREIQVRLRQGRSVADVAKAAGVEPDWIERFAAPVFAEQAQVIAQVRSSVLRRPRLGPSTRSIGEAVRQNLTDRNLTFSPEEFSEAWSTRLAANGRWVVRFAFTYRGKDQKLRYDLDETSGDVAPGDRLSAQLGYIAPAPQAKPNARATSTRTRNPTADGERTSPKRAVVTTGFRPDSAPIAPTSPAARERERAAAAMRKAAARGMAEAERAATRKAREKAEAAARLEQEERAEQARREREAAAAARARKAKARAKAAAKAEAKRAAEERAREIAEERARKAEARKAAAQAKRAEAALRAAEQAKKASRKRPAAKKAANKTTAKTAAPKTATANKAAPNRPPQQASARTATPRQLTRPPTAAPSPPAPSAPASQAPTVNPPPPGPRFRPGLVEQVIDERPPLTVAPVPRSPRAATTPDEPSDNGSEDRPAGLVPGRRPLDRPRRTRPLRAT